MRRTILRRCRYWAIGGLAAVVGLLRQRGRPRGRPGRDTRHLALEPLTGHLQCRLQPLLCKEWDCDLNTAIYTREQVGSSFTPYVLAAAVADGMNVQTSTLNANQYLCVPPDALASTLSKVQKYYSGSIAQCANNGMKGYFPVENDGGEVIGNSQGAAATPAACRTRWRSPRTPRSPTSPTGSPRRR